MSKIAKFAAIAAISVLSAGPALADGTGPKIGGNANVTIGTTGTVEQNVSAGVGNESEARQDLLSVKSGEVGGNVNMKLDGSVKQNVAAGVGNKSKACQSVGSIGGNC